MFPPFTSLSTVHDAVQAQTMVVIKLLDETAFLFVTIIVLLITAKIISQCD